MQTQCVRCDKTIDTVQGYKFSPTEYLCMSCYDEYKAERTAKAKKQHKNPLMDQFGTEGGTLTGEKTRRQPSPTPKTAPQQPAPPPAQPAAPQTPPQAAPGPQLFQPMKATPPPGESVQKPAAPQAPPSADVCDVCQKPIADFKVPLKGGKKVCMGCNEVLRDVAKSLVLNLQCPHCGKEIQFSQE